MAKVRSFTISPSKATTLISPSTRSSPQMNLVFTIPSTAIHPKFSTLTCSRPKTPNRYRTRTVAAADLPTAARDRVIDFGKHKGKMLGTLPSSYLKWMSENLRPGNKEEWARLADQVLADPIYRERIEWEVAERVLSGDSRNSYRDGSSAVEELREISERFGWDFEDKIGWGKVKLGLLGTSKGGRIPRLKDREKREEKITKMTKPKKLAGGDGGRRGERIERMRRRRAEKTTSGAAVEKEEEEEMMKDDEDEDDVVRVKNRFPGREAFLKKVLNRHNLL